MNAPKLLMAKAIPSLPHPYTLQPQKGNTESQWAHVSLHMQLGWEDHTCPFSMTLVPLKVGTVY